ncbi:MAG: ester cyclase [Chlamydiae bacterium]|nr:ester cyclase [Chlamydiota bacterium]
MTLLKWATIPIVLLSSLSAAEETPNPAKIFAPSVSGESIYQDRIRLVQTFYDIMQNNDITKLPTVLSNDYHLINASDLQETSYSKFTEMSKNLTVRIAALHKTFPDFQLTVTDLLVDKDQVLAKVSISGVQKGNFLGVAPTGKPIHIKIFDIFTIKDNKIISISEMWNELSVMKQLGYIVL